jgi:DNA-binding MarR family transcriptional regulator
MHKTKVSRPVARLARRRYLQRCTNYEDKREEHLTLPPTAARSMSKSRRWRSPSPSTFDDIAPSDRMAFERVLDSLTARMLSEDSQRMRNADK